MKKLVLSAILFALFMACGGKENNLANSNSSTQTKVTETTTAVSPAPSAATPTPATKDTKPPVEFTYLGVAPDKETIAFKIKVLSATPIRQVDIGIKYLDDSGKVLDETTYAWQNVVKSARQPIEQGKTYDGKDDLPEGAIKAECVLKRVIFADGTRWEAS